MVIHGRMKAGMAFAAMLAGALALTLAMVQADAAWAEDGQMTINRSAGGAASYRAYQVFTADVYAEGAETVATHIAWASDTARDVTLAFLQRTDARTGARVYADYTGGDNPQQAADYVSAKIRAGEADEAAGTEPATPAAGSFAMELGRALAASALGYSTVAAGETFTGPEGYWLFVADGLLADADAAGTAPLWLPIGGAAVTALAKEAVPTVRKEVREDSTGEWGPAADASVGEDLDYRITATLPANLGAFGTYHLKLVDSLPEGMGLAAGGAQQVKVSAGEVDITGQAHVDWAAGKLTVDIADIRSLADAEITRDTAVTVEYRAHLMEGCVVGNAGNRNSVVMAYTADPVTFEEAVTTPAATLTYTYGLSLAKCDKATAEALAGARFTIQAADTQKGPEGAAVSAFADSNAGRYLQRDGSFADAPFEFATDSGGGFSVSGLDEGTYVLREVSAPEGYELQDADITAVLASSLEGQELVGLSAFVSGGEQSKTGKDDVVTHVVRVETESGSADVQTSDDKKVALPLTGHDGVALLYGLGAGLALASLAGLAVLRWRGRVRRCGR